MRSPTQIFFFLAPLLNLANCLDYAPGTCHVSVQAQHWRNDAVNRFWVNIRSMTDNNGAAMAVSPGWQACSNECSWTSPLKDDMSIAVVGANDAGIINYVQYYVGDQQWRSTDHADSHTTGKCDILKYNDNYNSNGYNNEGYDDNLYDYQNMDCTFAC